LAAGMACEGARPVVAIYSTFLQRAYDQLIHDVALQNLNVLFAIDRAGLVGEDGPTHAGSFDLSFLRCIPNLVVMAPKDEAELRLMLSTGFYHDGPAAVRYPRGSGPGTTPGTDLATLPIGKAEVVRAGKKIALLAFGTMVEPARALADTLDATLVNMRFIKPLDHACLIQLRADHTHFVTLEENTVAGGAGSGVLEWFAAQGYSDPILNIGLPDAFLPHASANRQHAIARLDEVALRQRIQAWLESAPE
ncbi:MAG: transketolase C-terminal domain-containing protein, partial [Natronospirillum sp.]